MGHGNEWNVEPTNPVLDSSKPMVDGGRATTTTTTTVDELDDGRMLMVMTTDG